MRIPLLTAITLLFFAAIGSAQGHFYAEETRDGRIYAFNQMKIYESWKASGEIGISITRPGAGPNGETMVFDSEDAIHLYNFRHQLPPEVRIQTEPAKPKMNVSWKDGKTKIETDFAELNLSTRVQFRYTYEQKDGDRNDRQSFRIRRAKTIFQGWIYDKAFTYKFQANWADTTNALEDAWFNYDVFGDKILQFSGGQMKVPFGRQEMTSSGNLQFVDRSAVSNEFAKGYDIGAQLWGMAFGDRLEWHVGAFDGGGRNRTANDNRKFQYDARVAYQPFGDVKYSESDFETTDSPSLAIAAQYEKNDLHEATTADDVARETIGGDVVFKYRGFSLFAEYFDRQNRPEIAAETDTSGFDVNIGYFLIKDKLELAARYGAIDPSDAAEQDDRTETGLVVNWFMNKHNLKLQTDFRQLEDDAKKTKDKELRMQLQFIF